jgi:hypothetical protein
MFCATTHVPTGGVPILACATEVSSDDLLLSVRIRSIFGYCCRIIIRCYSFVSANSATVLAASSSLPKILSLVKTKKNIRRVLIDAHLAEENFATRKALKNMKTNDVDGQWDEQEGEEHRRKLEK